LAWAGAAGCLFGRKSFEEAWFKASLDAFYDGLTDEQRNAVAGVEMDMRQPYVASASEKLPVGASKVVFDKFHIAKLNCGGLNLYPH
jgi:hypothetical protein